MLKRICYICKKSFYVYPSELKQRTAKTCSWKCMGIYRSKFIKGFNHPMWKERAKKNCLICNSIFYCKQAYVNVRKTCSRKCAKIYFSQTTSGKNHWRWNDGRRKRNGWMALLVKNHPFAQKDGYVMEHRYIMEKHIGRFLKTNEYVHHINHNPYDNRIKNLQLISPTEHSRLHRLCKKY